MTQIEIIFLGTTASIPTKTRSQPSIYVRYQSENEHCYLFDCGEGAQRQMMSQKINFMRINDIFITHWHADHYAGLFGLLETMSLEGRKRELRIFAPEADRFVAVMMELGYAGRNFDIIPVNVEFEGKETEVLVDAEEYQILSIPVDHGVPAVAYAFKEKDRIKINKEKAKKLGLPSTGTIYKLMKEKGFVTFKGQTIKLKDISDMEKGKKIVYSGDTKPCANMVTLAEGADLLIHDSTYFEQLKRKHATFEEVIDIAKEAHVKQVIATHISRRYQNYKELKEKIEKYKNVQLAKDFMRIVLR